MHRRLHGVLLGGACALLLGGCGDSDAGTAASSADVGTEDAGPETPTPWFSDASDASDAATEETSENTSPGGVTTMDVPASPDEPEAGPTEPEPSVPDVFTEEEDVAVPADVSGPPVFEGDAVPSTDPTAPLLCTVSGSTNDVVDCELHMAAQAGSAEVAAMEFHFPLVPHAELVGITCASGGSDLCMGNLKGPLPSGHTYNASYDAASGASIIVFGLNAPSPLSPAVYDGTTISGQTFVLAFQLKRLSDVALDVHVPGPIFSDSGGTQLDLEIVDGVWVTSGG